jgi:4-alpha-glucanotransferase
MMYISFNSRARIAIAPLQDYLVLGSEARFNTPGLAENNWRWRVCESALDRSDLGWIGTLASATGRA